MPDSPTETTLVPRGGAQHGEIVHPNESARVVNPGLVLDAVRVVNAIHVNHGISAWRETGEYLLGAFYDGDIAEFHRLGRKHASMQALAENGDLGLSKTAVWSSIAFLEQLHLLPDDIGGALSFEHHKLLLPVKDPATKQELARVACEEKLGKRAFGQRVRAAKAPRAKNTRGRKPASALDRALAQFARLVEEICGHCRDVAAVKALDQDRVRTLTNVARRDLNRLDEALDDARSHAGVTLDVEEDREGDSDEG